MRPRRQRKTRINLKALAASEARLGRPENLSPLKLKDLTAKPDVLFKNSVKDGDPGTILLKDGYPRDKLYWEYDIVQNISDSTYMIDERDCGILVAKGILSKINYPRNPSLVNVVSYPKGDRPYVELTKFVPAGNFLYLDYGGKKLIKEGIKFALGLYTRDINNVLQLESIIPNIVSLWTTSSPILQHFAGSDIMQGPCTVPELTHILKTSFKKYTHNVRNIIEITEVTKANGTVCEETWTSNCVGSRVVLIEIFFDTDANILRTNIRNISANMEAFLELNTKEFYQRTDHDDDDYEALPESTAKHGMLLKAIIVVKKKKRRTRRNKRKRTQ